jgi:hypothetical protein
MTDPAAEPATEPAPEQEAPAAAAAEAGGPTLEGAANRETLVDIADAVRGGGAGGVESE